MTPAGTSIGAERVRSTAAKRSDDDGSIHGQRVKDLRSGRLNGQGQDMAGGVWPRAVPDGSQNSEEGI